MVVMFQSKHTTKTAYAGAEITGQCREVAIVARFEDSN